MREKIEGLTEAIILILQTHRHPLKLESIYSELLNGGVVEITSEQQEETYGQPNFQHSVRRTLTGLVRKGKISRTGRGIYLYIG